MLAAGAAVRIKSDTGLECHLRKCSITLVVVKEIGRGIVSLENIQPTVVVVVEGNDSQAFPSGVRDSGLLTDIGKGSVASCCERADWPSP